MNAFEFGWMMQKIAVGPFEQPGRTPPPAPQFNFGHARQMLARHYPNDYSGDMTSRQVWDKTKELGVIQPGTRQLTPFQAAMKYKYRGRMPAEPVFAGPGKPGFKPPANQVAGGGQQAAPRLPVQAPQQPQRPMIPNWQPGQPVPQGFVVNDRDQLMPQSPDFQRLTAGPAQAIPRMPAPPR